MSDYERQNELDRVWADELDRRLHAQLSFLAERPRVDDERPPRASIVWPQRVTWRCMRQRG